MDILGLREYILSYLNYKELCDIRLINNHYNNIIKEVNINDIETEINIIEIWKENFQKALGIKINNNWKDDDFQYLKRIEYLSMRCNFFDTF